MAGNAYHNLNTLAYDSTAISSCLGMQWQHVGTQAVSLIAGDGSAVHYVVLPTAISGTFTFHDPDEAEKMAEKVAATENATFNVKDQVDTAKTVTITNIKTSGVLGGAHNLGGAGPYVIQFVADSISDPV